MKAIILGGGFAGTTVAHLLHNEGWETTLIEREPHLGGGCYTYFHAGHPYTNGPRLYYGYSQKVFDWMNEFVKIRRFPFELRTLAHEVVDADRKFWTYPMHEDDLPHYPQAEQIAYELAMRDNTKEPADFEEYWIQRVGPTLYDMFVNNYSKKMWSIESNKMFDIFKWSAKDVPIASGGREAYKGSYIGYPKPHNGYNDYFDAMVEGITVIRGKKAQWLHGDAVRIGLNEVIHADVIVSTIPIDELCGVNGTLPYAGRDFYLLVLPCERVFPGNVRFCHYASAKDDWTRVTEFKQITWHKSDTTLLVLEKPSKANKLYPYLTKANMALVDGYLGDLPKHVWSIGRLGTYKYSTIEQTIIQAFRCAAELTGKANRMEGEWRGIGDVSLMKDRKESA